MQYYFVTAMRGYDFDEPQTQILEINRLSQLIAKIVHLLKNSGKFPTVKHINFVNKKFAMSCWSEMVSGK